MKTVFLRLSAAVLVVSAVGISGCATTRSGSIPASALDSSGGIPAPKSLNEVLVSDSMRKNLPPSVMKNPNEIIVRGIKLKNTGFDIPVTINSAVEGWVDYFTGRGRFYFEKYLERSEFFIPYIDPLLKQNGMPRDLVYLAMIESGFNNLARSHAKAVGPWQFMAATGKRYGLNVNWWTDERRDIKKSTLAAVEYLRDLYGMFQSWELAAAAYNAGENKVATAVKRYGTRDFWTIARQRYLRSETRNYVPKMIAAALIAKNREQFGFKAMRVNPGADEAVAGDGEIVKVVKTDKPLEDGRDRIEEVLGADDPNGEAEDVAETLEGDKAADKAADGTAKVIPVAATPTTKPNEVADGIPLAKPVPTPHVNRSGEVAGEELAEFDVRSPADLLKVARAAGLSYQTVKSLNPELQRWCTPPTVSTYRLKLPSSVKEKFLTTYNHAAFPRQVQFMTYLVKRNETLSKIAHQFGIKVDPIMELNGVSPRMPLRKGMRILLPMPNDRSRSLASLEVRDPPEKSKHRRHRYMKVDAKKRSAARYRASDS